MANRLEKLPLAVPPAGGGSGGSGGGGDPGGGDAGGGSGGGLPPQGSTCLASIEAKIKELWPFYEVIYVQPDAGPSYFRVAKIGLLWVWHITGSCQDGYVSLAYTTVGLTGLAAD